jgi:predicted CXXCH cytochrome family protein
MTDEARDHGSIHAALVGDRTRAGCLSCHDPHLSPNPTLLQDEGSDLCGTCHGAVLAAATAATGHPPAAEDCATCHAPHASPNRSLLTEATPDLCVMCHDVDDPDLATAHLGASMASLDCLGCHTPHGAGNENLLATNIHAVILDGCDTCHEGSHEAMIEDGESSLCLACHDDIGAAAEQAEFPHPAMEMVRCADCHNPHASAQEHLVTEPGGGECTTCHEDHAAGDGEVAHRIIEIVGCRACHQPHGGANPKLLRTQGNELCLGCHDSAAVRIPEGAVTVELVGRFEVSADVAATAAALQLSANKEHGHPIRNHRVFGFPTEDELKRTDTGFSGVLTCLTCHDPHKGRSKNLFRSGAASQPEVCAVCHQK